MYIDGERSCGRTIGDCVQDQARRPDAAAAARTSESSRTDNNTNLLVRYFLERILELPEINFSGAFHFRFLLRVDTISVGANYNEGLEHVQRFIAGVADPGLGSPGILTLANIKSASAFVNMPSITAKIGIKSIG